MDLAQMFADDEGLDSYTYEMLPADFAERLFYEIADILKREIKTADIPDDIIICSEATAKNLEAFFNNGVRGLPSFVIELEETKPFQTKFTWDNKSTDPASP